MGSPFHEHEDGFRGAHSHAVNGVELAHVHAGTDDLPVVEVDGHRYKRPKAAANPDAEAVTLEVHDSDHSADSALR